MAYCPQCRGVLEAAAVVCPHCGYDFPPGSPDRRRGIVYSPLADLALIIGIVAAGLGCAVALVGSVFALLRSQWLEALIVGPLTFFLLLAMLVVFVRVQRI
jgi:Uncharacterised protein family UPF0547